MGQQLPKGTSVLFYTPGSTPAQVTVLSPLEWWYSHWDPDVGRSRRCGQVKCALCARGLPIVLRFVLLIQLQNGLKCLLELRERHREELEAIAKSDRGFVGAKLEVWRNASNKHAKIQVEHVGFDSTIVPHEISRLMPCLGLPATLVGQ